MLKSILFVFPFATMSESNYNNTEATEFENENYLIDRYPIENRLGYWIVNFFPEIEGRAHTMFVQNAIIIESGKKLTGQMTRPLKWQQDFLLKEFFWVARQLVQSNFTSKFEFLLLTSKVVGSKSTTVTGKVLYSKFKNLMKIIKNRIVCHLPKSWKGYGSGNGLRSCFIKCILAIYKEHNLVSVFFCFKYFFNI